MRYKKSGKWRTFLPDEYFPLDEEAAAAELARRQLALLHRLHPGGYEQQQPQPAAAPAASVAQLRQTARALAVQGAEAQAHAGKHAAKLLCRLLLPGFAAGVQAAAHFGDRVLPKAEDAAAAAAAAGEDEAAAAAAAAAADAGAAAAAGEAAYAEARRQAALDADPEDEEEEEAAAAHEPVDHEYGGRRCVAAVRGSSVRRVASTLGACAARCLFCHGSNGTLCSHCGGSGRVERALAAPGMPLQHLLVGAPPQQVSQHMQQQAEQQGMQGPWYSKRNDVGHSLAVAHADARLEADVVDSLPNLYPQDRCCGWVVLGRVELSPPKGVAAFAAAC